VVWLLACAALLSSARADTVELQPGTLTGTVAFTGETVLGGSVSASSPDGYSASASFTGTDYSLTVAGDKTWGLNYLSARLSITGQNTTLWVYDYRAGSQVTVPAGATVDWDRAYDTARIQATIAVTGGTLTGYSVSASGSEPNISYSASVNAGSLSGNGAFVIPMLLDSQIQVSGVAYVRNSANQDMTVALESKAVAVTAAGAQVSWAPDLNALSANAGSLAANLNLQAPSVVSQYRVSLSGADSATAGLYLSRTFANSGLNTVTGLTPGRYYAYAYADLNAPFTFLQFPTPPEFTQGQVQILAGQATPVNWVRDLGYAQGSITLDGFASLSDLSYGYVYADGVNNSPTAGGYGYDYFDRQAPQFNLALVAGPYNVYRHMLRFYNTSDPARPLNVQLNSDDYTRVPGYGGSSVNLVAGQTTQVPDFQVTTSAGEVLFDVVEAAGQPEVPITNPRVYGFNSRYNAQGQYLGYRQFYAFGPSQAQARPTVQIVAEPGTYTATADAYVSGSYTVFSRFNLVIEPPATTPSGSNVKVEPSPTVDLVFANVTTPGVTTVTEVPFGPEAPPGFKINSPGGTPIYYDIKTTAVFDGLVQVCVAYDDTGLAQNKEKNLKLLHYNATKKTYENITTSLDVDNNVICGETASFSLFVVAYSSDAVIESIVADPLFLRPTELVQLDATFSDEDPNDLHTAVIDWGDGSSETLPDLGASARTISQPHAYNVGGSYQVKLTITDLAGNATTASTGPVRVNTPPVAHAGADRMVSTDGACGADVELDGRGSADADRDALTFTWRGDFGEACGMTPTVRLAKGEHTITLTVKDIHGDVATDTVTIEVADQTAPTITSLTATPNILGPPNHAMTPVTLVPVVNDACDAAPQTRIAAVSSNEPENGLGDGDTAPDWEITGDLSLNLRAERSGTGTGRIYTITVESIDAAGNRSTRDVTVTVPRDQRKP
jgi:hypothetical protein